MAAQTDKHARDVHRPTHVAPERIAPDAPAEDVRQAKKLGVVRWVLGISFALAVIALLLVYFIVLAPKT